MIFSLVKKSLAIAALTAFFALAGCVTADSSTSGNSAGSQTAAANNSNMGNAFHMP